MIDDKENRKLTWEYYKKEREKISTEIKKRNKLEIEKNNRTLVALRDIPVEDIQKSFDDLYNDNDLESMQLKAIVTLAYLTKADFSELDAIDIKNISKAYKDNGLEKFLKNLKDNLNIKENSNNNIQYFNLLKSYLQSWLNELKKQKIIEGQFLTSIEGKKIIKSSSQRTLRYTLNEYLQLISEFQPYKDNDPSLHKLDIQFLKRNNIDKKIDYLAYEKKAFDGKLKQSELFEADTKELEITNPENYLDGISGKKTGIETEDNAKIKSTDLSFTGQFNLNNKTTNKLIFSKTFIQGRLNDYTKYKYYDSNFGFLSGGKKVTTPKLEIIFLSNGKKFSEFEYENHFFKFNYDDDWMSDEVYPVVIPKGFIRIFDDEGNVQQTFYRKGNRIIPCPEPIKNTSKSSKKTHALSNVILKKNYYPVILYESEYGIGGGEDSTGCGDPEFILENATGDGSWLGTDGFFHTEFNIVIASFNFLDEFSVLFFIKESFDRRRNEVQNEVQNYNETKKNEIYDKIFSIKIDDKFNIPSNIAKKHKLMAELHFMEYENCLDIDKKLFGLHETEFKIKNLGAIPIVSKKIFISALGTFDCKNGWYDAYHKDIYQSRLSEKSKSSASDLSRSSIDFLSFGYRTPINKNESDDLIKEARKYFKQYEY